MGRYMTFKANMIMLTCEFGAGVTQIVWSLNIARICRVFSFFDDYMGAGSKKGALTSQELSNTMIREGVGYEGQSAKKNVFYRKTEIFGIQVNCIEGMLRTKEKALNRLVFVLFSIEIKEAQGLKY